MTGLRGKTVAQGTIVEMNDWQNGAIRPNGDSGKTPDVTFRIRPRALYALGAET